MTISNITLVKIAAVGGVATVTMGLIAKIKIQDNIRATPFYKDALKLVRAHPGAVQLLGEPIKDRAVDITAKTNFCKDNKAQYEVPLKGQIKKGILYFWASRLSEGTPWTIDRIELEVDKLSDKRLVIKKEDRKSN